MGHGDGARSLRPAPLITIPGSADLAAVRSAFDALDPDSGDRPTLRVVRCRPTAAFTGRDRLLPGYAEACEVARGLGFEPVLRPVGGHLAAYDEGCVVLHLWAPQHDAGEGITDRFERYGRVIADALRDLGVPDVRVGAVPGEYCDGEWSVNTAGRHKIVGTGQRISRRGYLFSAVATVTGADRLRDVLVPTYERLGLTLDPATVGAVEDSVPGIGVDQVSGAMSTALSTDLGNN